MAKILIVDDSRTSRRMLRNILVENGHEVIGKQRMVRLDLKSILN